MKQTIALILLALMAVDAAAASLTKKQVRKIAKQEIIRSIQKGLTAPGLVGPQGPAGTAIPGTPGPQGPQGPPGPSGGIGSFRFAHLLGGHVDLGKSNGITQDNVFFFDIPNKPALFFCITGLPVPVSGVQVSSGWGEGANQNITVDIAGAASDEDEHVPHLTDGTDCQAIIGLAPEGATDPEDFYVFVY